MPIRREWLAHGLSTKPADRSAAEELLAGVYARHGRARPRFIWIDSARRAGLLLRGLPTHDVLQSWIHGRRPAGQPPLASDIAAGVSRLRSALDATISLPDPNPPGQKKAKPERTEPGKKRPPLPPEEELAIGTPLREVLRIGIRDALARTLVRGFIQPVRAWLTETHLLPVAWYGQQDAYWIAYYDALRRLGMADFRRCDEARFDEWAQLARVCGWWWPGEDTCVVSERPASVDTEPLRGGCYEEVIPVQVRYRDDWLVPRHQLTRPR